MLDVFSLIGQFFYSVFNVLFRYGFSMNGAFVSVGSVLVACTLISFLIFAFWRGVHK